MRWLGHSRSSRVVDILVVCSGNVCRSQYVSALLAAELPDLTISSAGTGALVGQQPVAEVQEMLAGRGIEVGTASARALTRRLVRSSRLIITAARVHRGLAVALDSTAAGRAFTLKELARVTNDARVDRFSTVLDAAAAAAQVQDPIDFNDDLDDPIGREWSAFEQMAAEVDVALGILVPALRR